MKPGTIIALAAINGLIATMLSALGAHYLKSRMDDAGAAWFAQGTDFHLIHALAMLGAALLASIGAHTLASRAAWAMQAGILCFSGTLYIRAIGGAGALGSFHWVTPIGGVLLMAGWALMIAGGMKASRS